MPDYDDYADYIEPDNDQILAALAQLQQTHPELSITQIGRAHV